MQADFEFEDGAPQTQTVDDFAEAMQEDIVNVLASVTADLLASSTDGCTGELGSGVTVGNIYASCDVVAVADDIRTEIDAVTDFGKAPTSCVEMHVLLHTICHTFHETVRCIIRCTIDMSRIMK